MKALLILTRPILLSALLDIAPAAEPQVADRLIGYTELQTNPPGGWHANIATLGCRSRSWALMARP